MLWIEPSAVCNLRCTGCPTACGMEAGGLMSLDDFQSILGRIPRTVRMLNLWHRGEPLAAPDFPEMVAAAALRGIKTQTLTNGTLLARNSTAERLVDAKLTRISIAVDGADEATYRAFRPGGALAEVEAGVRALAAAKRARSSKRPRIVVECLVGRQGTAQFESIKRQAFEWGADEVKFKTLRIENLADVPVALARLPEDPRLWRYDLTQNGLRMKRIRSGCRRLAYTTLIAWNGDIYPCCFYLKSFAPFGNIFEEPFDAIWSESKLTEFQKIVAAERDSIPMCRNCTEGLPYLYVNPLQTVSQPGSCLSKPFFFGYPLKRYFSRQGG